MGWLLNIVALILFVVIFIIDLFVRIFTKRSNKSAYSNGFKINVFGNELFPETLNLFLLKRSVNLFGVFGEPISSVLGKAYRDNQLNYFGHAIRFLVDAFDVPMWIKGKSHCLHWIRSDEEIKEYVLTLN
jgi:hypothetical protein